MWGFKVKKKNESKNRRKKAGASNARRQEKRSGVQVEQPVQRPPVRRQVQQKVPSKRFAGLRRLLSGE